MNNLLLTIKLYNHDLLGFVWEFRVSLKFHMIVQVFLQDIEGSSGLSELFINYKQYFLKCYLYKTDLQRLACEFSVSLEFYEIVLGLLYGIERSSGFSKLLVSYQQILLTFQLHDYDLLGFACESRVSLRVKFYIIVLVLLHEIESSSGLSKVHINYKQFFLTFELYNPGLLWF